MNRNTRSKKICPDSRTQKGTETSVDKAVDSSAEDISKKPKADTYSHKNSNMDLRCRKGQSKPYWWILGLDI